MERHQRRSAPPKITEAVHRDLSGEVPVAEA
jgi:hypothetical protein